MANNRGIFIAYDDPYLRRKDEKIAVVEKTTAEIYAEMQNPNKVYVDVVLKNDAAGGLHPLQVIWEDGRSFAIDRVLECRRMASTKAGGTGMRYTVRVQGNATHLWHEQNRWFVERKHP